LIAKLFELRIAHPSDLAPAIEVAAFDALLESMKHLANPGHLLGEATMICVVDETEVP
jgi:hypothetical protein